MVLEDLNGLYRQQKLSEEEVAKIGDILDNYRHNAVSMTGIDLMLVSGMLSCEERLL